MRSPTVTSANAGVILAAIRDKDHLNPALVQIPDCPAVLVMRRVQRLVSDGLVEGAVCKGNDPEALLFQSRT
ncbi:MAG: hypothetical protein GDA49_09280 [Rhodospirillales bacterium]|nr:hypothetical protein [Rhodospirillales bacterium]